MAEIHVRNGRVYATTVPGLIVRRDELAFLEATGGAASIVSGAVVGPQSYDGSDGSMTITADGRLRVDTSPTNESVNLFAAPSAWDGGNPWSSKSPW